jgi:Rps23 Pro-64 3,4-dihydroxylase Tpa1-like proline 4-hydroxylase
MNSKLLQNNYIIIPNFISPYRATELSAEFETYCKKNNLTGDPQAPSSYSKYNYISFLELLCEKTQEISSILEETVLPTYVYSRVYFNGSVLEKHTDRDACEISLTLHLNGDEPWPIWIKTPSGEEKSVILYPGDAMMYLGKIAEHWRNAYNGEKYSQIFLHYVRSRGDCSYTYFDKNKEKEKNSDEGEFESMSHNTNDIEQDKINQELNDNKKTKISSPTLIVPKSATKLENYIHVFDNIVPAHFCEEILSEYKNSNDWLDALVGGGVVNKSSRNCNQILISDYQIISKNNDIRRSIDDRLHKCVMEAITKYHEEHPLFKIDIDTGYQLLRYNEGEFYTQHVDSFKEQQRSVSCSIILNEDYEGGEFAFFDREIMIRSATGSVIMFPSNFMYPHEVMPVINGTRYSIITWLV